MTKFRDGLWAVAFAPVLFVLLIPGDTSLVASASAMPLHGESSWAWADVRDVPFRMGAMWDCGYCSQFECGDESHSFQNFNGNGPDRAYGEGTHGCQSGWCGAAHPPCLTYAGLQISPGSLSKVVWDIALGREPAETGAALPVGTSELVVQNSDRDALQVVGCTGEIILNAPLHADAGRSLYDQ